MQRRIITATAVVAATTLLIGLVALVVMRRSIDNRAEQELRRQAAVTASQIEEDLERVEFRPGANPGVAVARYRNELLRSLSRAESLGGHDRVEGSISVGARQIPITQPLVLIPLLPPGTGDGDIVTIEVGDDRMLVAVEILEAQRSTLTIAIGRSQPLLAAAVVTIPVTVAVAVGAALTVALGIWFARSLSRRLRGLETAAEAVGGGNLDARAEVDGTDEIASVAEAFNSMASQLQFVRNREREFLMSVSHDLRTPLTTIRGYAEALDAGDIPSDDLSRVAGVLNTQTDQLARLVEDVMLLGRLEAHQYTLRPESVDVSALVRGVTDGFIPQAATYGVSLSVDAGACGDRVIDPERIVQVLSNLIENALRYTPEMGSIAVTLTDDALGFVVDVHNTGPGIAERDLPRVFDRLYVADRYRAIRPSGSGLGLAIVAELVSAMGGTVTCESDPSSGTTFCVVFPVVRA
ncbi:MAG: HAMP domain-containing histidine kinase [Acidimicrobiia bacterium]|nr:HAMP domain-containing histidine kinase [Acidimicrobiia bacterium]